MKFKPDLKIQLKNPLKNMSKKKKIVLAIGTVAIIGVIIAAVSFNSRKNRMHDDMEAAFTIETAAIERQTLTNSISATGTVASAETKTVNTSLKDLEVVAVYVKEGDYVEEGTVICEFDSSDYEEALAEAQHNASINAQIEALNESSSIDTSVENAFDSLQDSSSSKDDAEDACDEAAEELADAEDDLDDAYASYVAAKNKYDGKKTDIEQQESVLAAYKAKYDETLKDYSQKKVNYELLKSKYENKSESDSNNTVSENDVTTAETAMENAETAMNDAKAAYDAALKDSNELTAIKTAYEKAESTYKSAQSAVSAAEKTLEQAETTLEQAEDKLDSAWENYDDAVEKADEQAAKEALEDQLITETQEEKAINEYTELIEDCVVVASMSGVITSLNVTEGNIFEGGDVYTIQDNEHFIVSSSVDEYDISSIEKGMSAYIKTDATGDTEMTGEVSYVAIAPTGNGAMGAISNSASYTIEVTIDEADENLRAGMTAKISIALEESADALTVPYDAVTTTPDGTSTITADVDGEKKTIAVEIGLETDYYTEIISDEISEGMTVYLSTPMVTSGTGDEENRNGMESFFAMPGGNMPSGDGGRGGNMPSGGERPSGTAMPSGGPGGF